MRRTTPLALLLVILVVIFYSPPTFSQGAELQNHSPIIIDGDGSFTSANGVTGGAGTASDPYRIEGWEISSGSEGVGVEIRNTNAHFVIRDISLTQFDNGTLILNASNGRLEGSRIRNNRSNGVMVLSSSNITIANNDISGNGYLIPGTAVFVRQSSMITISENSISSRSALYAINSTRLTISGNSIWGDYYAGRGFTFSSSNETLVYHNDILVNVCVPSPSYCGTLVEADSGSVIVWNSGYPAGGNYWRGYEGVDNCNGPNQDVCSAPDGIGDAPVAIAGGGQAHYPLIGPNDKSPPAWPAGSTLVASWIVSTSVRVSWTEAIDNREVVRYQLFQDALPIDPYCDGPRTCNVKGLDPFKNHTFKVDAIDAAGSRSTDGPSTTVVSIPRVVFLFAVGVYVALVGGTLTFIFRKERLRRRALSSVGLSQRIQLY